MRILKIGIAAIVVVICASIAVFAVAAQQDKDGSQMNGPGFMHMQKAMPDMILGHLKERLKLTDEQVAQIKPIFEESMKKQFEKFGEFKGKTDIDWEAVKKEREAAQQEMEQKLSKILTKDQMKEFQAMHKEFGQFGPGRPGFGPGFGRGNKGGKFEGNGFFGLMKELNITDAQKEKIFGILKKSGEGHKAGAGNFMSMQKDLLTMILTEGYNESAVRQLFQDSSDKFENSFVAHAKMLSEMKAVLTTDQVALLKKKLPELMKKMQEGKPAGFPMMGPPMFMRDKNNDK